jgi:hypothetical protein
VRQRIVERRVREDHREFFAAVAERTSAAAHLRQPRADHAQQLIAGVVTIRIVETLEMIEVDHRDRVGALEPAERLGQCAAARQPGQLVAVRDRVRRLDQRHEQHKPGAGERDRRRRGRRRGERDQRADLRPEHPALQSLWTDRESQAGEAERRGEREHADQRQPAGIKRLREHIRDGGGFRLGEQRGAECLDGDKPDTHGKDGTRALWQPCERGQIQRQGRRGHGGHDVRGRRGHRERDGERALGGGQHERCDEHAPAPKAPREQRAGEKGDERICGEQRARDWRQHGNDEQGYGRRRQEAAGQKADGQGLQRMEPGAMGD